MTLLPGLMNFTHHEIFLTDEQLFLNRWSFILQTSLWPALQGDWQFYQETPILWDLLFVFLLFKSFTYFWNWFSTEKDVVLPILPFLWALTMCFCILAVSGREEKWSGTKIAHNWFFFITLLLFLMEISRLFAEVWCVFSQLRRQRPQANSLPCSLAPRTNVHPVKKLHTH